ncbi:MAG: cobalamin B12-binding domain-containing protein, partial [Candidatus Helarchaeota archaeon]|nr:cobalamin B12-binding domain-containing protein [Candidatus Helarchaeota archaeon]
IISADAMIGVMEIIKPHLEGDPNQKPMGTILIGSAEGDVHSIGKNLMISLLQGQGFKVIDLGTDVPPDKFIEEAKKSKPDVIGISGLLTESISTMQKTVLMLKEENIPSKIIVGGGILTVESCTMIGADDFATDGWDGLKKINKLVERAE